MAKLFLHGRLGKKFGKEFNLKVPTGQKVLQVMFANFPKLENALRKGYFKFDICGKLVTGSTEEEASGEVMRALIGPVGESDEIHITPAIQGAGSNGGIFMVVAGVVAVAAAFFTGGASIALWSAGTAALAASGAAMVVGGIAMMLTKMPAATLPKASTSKSEKSSGFSNLDNMAGQGQALALIYGENLVGSSVVSQQIQTLTKGIS